MEQKYNIIYDLRRTIDDFFLMIWRIWRIWRIWGFEDCRNVAVMFVWSKAEPWFCYENLRFTKDDWRFFGGTIWMYLMIWRIWWFERFDDCRNVAVMFVWSKAEPWFCYEAKAVSGSTFQVSRFRFLWLRRFMGLLWYLVSATCGTIKGGRYARTAKPSMQLNWTN